MNRGMKLVLLFSVFVFGSLWLSSYISNTEKKKKTEIITFSQFKKMLNKKGQKTIGKIYTNPTIKRKELPELLSVFGLDTNFILQISPRKIWGRYTKPEIRIEKNDDIERLLERTLPFVVEVLPGMVTEDLLKKLERNKIAYKFVNEQEEGFLSSFFSFLPILLIVFLLWMFMMRQIQNSGNRALSFGKSRAKLNNAEDKKKITFLDVAGCNEAKQELLEVVDFLKAPNRFRNIGAKIPRGILLVGPPGTGKTLLSRAVAGEADVPFYSISGSDFVEMFVGVGASRVRDLFAQAKKNSPCIIFVDEIDAVGRLRGAGLGGGHDEREQTLNQMLVEMDGFSENEGIIIIAATNRPDVLDPALLRPGRFDRQVVVDIPDLQGREEILKVHIKKIKIDADVDLNQIARGTPGFTGADLANLINEAALLAARNQKEKVTITEMEEAKDKVLMGPERRSFLITTKEKEVIAYHEAGHTLLGLLLPYAEPIHKVTIIPRGRALGLTQSLPEEDRHIQPKKYWEDRICVLMGGYIAEETIFKDTSTGAANDIEVATKISRRMVCEWGMSEQMGTVSYGSSNNNIFLGREMANSREYSENTAFKIDSEVKRIVEEQLKRGRSLIKKNIEKLGKIAKGLLAEETISAERLNTILKREQKDISDTPTKKETSSLEENTSLQPNPAT